ncbi:MAG: LptF/LptG family permease [Syntrophobacterales bacterium]|nr:LptF/LptG family permease [Syntrophobacterales bacterium]
MKILERYILKELIGPYTLSLLVSFSLLSLGRMIQVARYIFQSSVTLKDILELIFFAIPRLSIFAIPLATTFAVTITLNRLSLSGEIIAIEGSGIPVHRLYKPFLIFTTLNTAISLIITLTVIHGTNTLFRTKIYQIGKASVTAIFSQREVFIDTIPGFVFYFREVLPPGMTVHGVYVEDFRESKNSFTIVASRGFIEYEMEEGNIVLLLEDGTIAETDKTETGHILSFYRYKLVFPANELLKELSKASSTKWEMNMRQLWKATQEATTVREKSRYGIEFHQRIALPFLSLILGMLMLPVSTLNSIRRFTKRVPPVLIAFSCFLLFYVLLALGKGFAENGLIGPVAAVYIPIGIFMALLFYFWNKMIPPLREHASKR